MKKLFLTGIAALFLATGASQANEDLEHEDRTEQKELKNAR
jgi:hypothetical protein